MAFRRTLDTSQKDNPIFILFTPKSSPIDLPGHGIQVYNRNRLLNEPFDLMPFKLGRLDLIEFTNFISFILHFGLAIAELPVD